MPIDAVADDSDSDDGNNGDFEQMEIGPFVQVARGRSGNYSRSASSSKSASSISSGSLSPPTPITPISNVFEPLVDNFIVREAPNSWDVRRHSPRAFRLQVAARLKSSRSQGEFVGRSTRPDRNSAKFLTHCDDAGHTSRLGGSAGQLL